MNTTLFTTGYHALMPEAYPTIDRNRLKSYGDKYYLNDGQQFQLELYNPNWMSNIMVKIWMNGKCISPNGLVISSNDRVYLERYLDTNKKFKFKTFEVDDVQQTEEARERNGVVKLEFYQQYLPSTITYTNYPTFTVNNTANLNCVSTNPLRGDITYMSGGTVNASYISNSTTTNSIPMSKVETGRVFEGDISNQKMKTDYSSFMITPFHTVEFQLLPYSLKPTELSDIRNYCEECGYRIRKSNWKYCPTCGNKL